MKKLAAPRPDAQHSTVAGFWVNPGDVLRPAYQTDPSIHKRTTKLDKDAGGFYKTWFNGNIIYPYFDSACPWTRPGYTYDWADNGTKYGSSEFPVDQNAEAQVAFTETTQDFLDHLAADQFAAPTPWPWKNRRAENGRLFQKNRRTSRISELCGGFVRKEESPRVIIFTI